MDVFLDFFLLFFLIFILTFLVLFLLLYLCSKKHENSVLEGLRSCASQDEISSYLKSLSFGDIKFICDRYGLDITYFIHKDD